MTANNSCYRGAAIAYSLLYTIRKNAQNVFCINLHVSYALNIHFAELTWMRFWLPFFGGILKFFKKFISFTCDGIVSHILGPGYISLPKP